jgi:hypothetical protein
MPIVRDSLAPSPIPPPSLRPPRFVAVGVHAVAVLTWNIHVVIYKHPLPSCRMADSLCKREILVSGPKRTVRCAWERGLPRTSPQNFVVSSAAWTSAISWASPASLTEKRPEAGGFGRGMMFEGALPPEDFASGPHPPSKLEMSAGAIVGHPSGLMGMPLIGCIMFRTACASGSEIQFMRGMRG